MKRKIDGLNRGIIVRIVGAFRSEVTVIIYCHLSSQTGNKTRISLRLHAADRKLFMQLRLKVNIMTNIIQLNGTRGEYMIINKKIYSLTNIKDLASPQKWAS